MQICVQLATNSGIELLSALDSYPQYINIYNTNFNTTMTIICIKVVSDYVNIMNMINYYNVTFTEYEIIHNNNNINYHTKDNPWFVTFIVVIGIGLCIILISLIAFCVWFSSARISNWY
jgi:hypothetical protein